MPIFCDEAGYTGYNLLEEIQPYFVYCALNISDEEASVFVKYLKQKFHIQGELKGANQFRTTNGQKAIEELFEKYFDNVKIVFHHKKYALACKFYEYIFEPVVSQYSTFFYREGFNRFIANIIFGSLHNKTGNAENIFSSFQKLLKGEDVVGLFKLFENDSDDNLLLNWIAQFTIQHKESIIEEITTDGEIMYWVLDLAQSALYNLLCLWSEEIGALEVICDTSKPLKEAVDNSTVFSKLNNEIIYTDHFGVKIPITFNLSKPIKFSISKNCPGLQMADLFSSTIFQALKNPEESFSKKILDYIPEIQAKTGTFCIMPQPEPYLDRKSIQFSFGVTALKHLTQFSLKQPETAAAMFIEYFRLEVEKIRKISKKL